MTDRITSSTSSGVEILSSLSSLSSAAVINEGGATRFVASSTLSRRDAAGGSQDGLSPIAHPRPGKIGIVNLFNVERHEKSELAPEGEHSKIGWGYPSEGSPDSQFSEASSTGLFPRPFDGALQLSLQETSAENQ
ncbi:hypothetical protein [Mesorhizobium sp. B2-4-6]|uniref:hypothetical protein n=1 Tax=Mesorhizobium sp. B2-4-6 TaxID=2589943 RepID=UPI0011282E0C|nr:hypothetical protein [Mesorhizobium sp. B2-4-6]TPL40778.1 hypothetical protein FJ957_26520 [Mesorhizobium sp. B2-4-6]